MARGRSSPAFVHQFEGKEVLEGLLRACGNPCSAEEVRERMGDGRERGLSAREVIPGLFEAEPRFADPSMARRLYQNLLGLWDLVSSGSPVPLEAGEKGPRRLPRQPPPGPFGADGPEAEFVEKAWRYLEDLDKRGGDRLQHSFENRQDGLVGFLREQGLSDCGFDCAYQLVFELFCMIELGWPPGTRSVGRVELERGGQGTQQAPATLLEYADEAVFEAEQDEESPLAPDEAARLRAAVRRCLSALWVARRTK